MIRVWLVIAMLVGCERSDEGFAIGWRPAAVGQRIEVTTKFEYSDLRHAASSTRDQVQRFEVLAVTGDRVTRVKYESVQDDHVVRSARVEGVVGTFEASRPAVGNNISVKKLDGGVPTNAERYEVTRAVDGLLTTMQLQRSFFTHRFHSGERYEPTADERLGLGIDDKAKVSITLVSHDDTGLVLSFDGEGSNERAGSGFARGVLTGRFEIATDGQRQHTVTDTDNFDGGGVKIGHTHHESVQVTLGK